ncbi:hypothetical protein Syun_016804 [Stephania yunnanensis]|uniref:Uncharacterized protein n=1 Tax=Stephania yunnanensis TaxID=152371 RepID=A0AAP0J5F8_9MAGN
MSRPGTRVCLALSRLYDPALGLMTYAVKSEAKNYVKYCIYMQWNNYQRICLETRNTKLMKR